MFRCCSLETSHPRLLPQSLKDCSIHLCLFFCFAYRVIINIFLNSIFSNESVLRIRWPKYWSFMFNISPFNEYSGLTSFRMDWLNLLELQGKGVWDTIKTSIYIIGVRRRGKKKEKFMQRYND